MPILNIQEIVDHCRDAYRSCFMRWTSGESWPATKNNEFAMRMFFENGEIKSGYQNVRIICFQPERDILAGKPHAAVNGIIDLTPSLNGTSQEPQYDALIMTSQKLINSDQVTRKEIFAQEFLEIAIALNDIEEFEKRRLVSINREAVDIVSELGGRPIWEDSEERKRQIRLGLDSLLLSFGSIRKYLERIRGVGTDGFLDQVRDRQVNFGELANGLANYYNIRGDLAMERLIEFVRENLRKAA